VRDITGLNKLNIIMDRNDDTMIDLILGTVGSIIFVAIKTISYCYKNNFCKPKKSRKK